MSKSITQDMAYRQSLMKYAEKYGVSRASRKYNKKAGHTSTSEAALGRSVASLACQSRRPHSHPNQHTEAELKLIRDMRRRQSDPGYGRTLAPSAAARLHPLSREFVPCHAQNGPVSSRKAEKYIQAQALRADDPPRRARSGGCEGRNAQVHRRSGASAVPVHRYRRVHTAALSGGVSGAIHLFLGGLPAQAAKVLPTRFTSNSGCFLPQRAAQKLRRINKEISAMTKKQQADLDDSQPAERRCLFDVLSFSSNACSFTRECNADFYN